MFDLACAAARDVKGMAGGEEFLVLLAVEFVAELQGAIFGFEYGSANGEEIVVARRMQIAASNVRYDDIRVIVYFHLLVVETQRAHEFNAANLEPDQVIGVVNDAHLVGFGVADANGFIVMSEHWAENSMPEIEE